MNARTIQTCDLNLHRLLPAIFATCLASPLPSVAAGARWQPIGPDGGWVTYLVVDPVNHGTVYATTATTGIFKTTDHGATRGARPWLPLDSLCRHRRRALPPQARAVTGSARWFVPATCPPRRHPQSFSFSAPRVLQTYSVPVGTAHLSPFAIRGSGRSDPHGRASARLGRRRA